MKKTDKRQAELKDLINTILDERLKGVVSFNDDQSFIGYNPIEAIRGSLFHWVAVPFNGENRFCQLRCPNATQIEQCGDFTNIMQESKDGKPMEYEEIIKIRNYQEALCKITFNKPVFDHILELIGVNDFVISEKRKEFEIIKKQYMENEDKMSETEKAVLETKIKTLELETGFILPDDTMNFITRWAMGNDISDIKKITRENFLRAAALAKAHNKAPSDYISGKFTDFNKKEIDTHALLVLDEYMKDQRTVNEGKYKWFLGGRKQTGGLNLSEKH
ncbi:MAG: hypothetical protein LBQ93_03745 [Treponema sp.]|jgi:hypothetical protein|nr:hypothetical protein [Treponema sp.]